MEYKISASSAFKKYSDMVYRLAIARVKNTYDADDILQEVFLRFIKCKDKIPYITFSQVAGLTLTACKPFGVSIKSKSTL